MKHADDLAERITLQSSLFTIAFRGPDHKLGMSEREIDEFLVFLEHGPKALSPDFDARTSASGAWHDACAPPV